MKNIQAVRTNCIHLQASIVSEFVEIGYKIVSEKCYRKYFFFGEMNYVTRLKK